MRILFLGILSFSEEYAEKKEKKKSQTFFFLHELLSFCHSLLRCLLLTIY